MIANECRYSCAGVQRMCDAKIGKRRPGHGMNMVKTMRVMNNFGEEMKLQSIVLPLRKPC